MTKPIEKIYLTSIGTVELNLEKLIPALKTVYNCPVEIIPGFSDRVSPPPSPKWLRRPSKALAVAQVEFAYNEKRKQYYAPRLLQELEKIFSNQLTNQPPLKADPPQAETIRLVGIIDRDLYDEGLNFIFGEARGKVTIVSIWRFKPCTKINIEEEEKILLERTSKTVIHELGHTLGFGHCSNRKCVMFFSNWLGDTDYKEKTFCEKCRKKLW